ncbi:MAG: tRNA threonylcarbamoyladenosine biosynthesis protein TsaB [Chloroflexota bacterium]|nr:tRNA threonylcarbamoyladenosine biosynthesis protein TsaB [Chloroflexota bacterium]
MTGPRPSDAPDGVILAIDSATTRIVVAVGTTDGAVLEATDWPAGYRHGESLMPAIDATVDRLGIERGRIAAVVVGTGPGAFTGLRVGIATAKGLAHGLGRPIIGISTADALLSGTPDDAVLLLPAGPSDRLQVRRGVPATLVPAGMEPGIEPGRPVFALDLVDRAPADALERGEAARARLGASLITMAAARLAAGDVDDLARLVPEYVTLPRGVQAEVGEVSWSRDRR